jgi:hypothetical protein
VIRDHEIGSVCLTYVLEELKGESAETVTMGDHNFFDISSHDFVHQPKQAFSFEVEAGPDVADDFVLWVRFFD